MRPGDTVGYLFFFFNDTATTEIYPLSLHDALPISLLSSPSRVRSCSCAAARRAADWSDGSSSCLSLETISSTGTSTRSEEHTSELQSRQYLVCRLLLEKKKTN